MRLMELKSILMPEHFRRTYALSEVHIGDGKEKTETPLETFEYDELMKESKYDDRVVAELSADNVGMVEVEYRIGIYEEPRISCDTLFIDPETKRCKYLSVRTSYCLARNGVRTVGDLCNLTEDGLLKIRNLGMKSNREIHSFLRKNGFSLKGEGEE